MVGWWGGGGGGGVAMGSFSSSFIASMLYIRVSCTVLCVACKLCVLYVVISSTIESVCVCVCVCVQVNEDGKSVRRHPDNAVPDIFDPEFRKEMTDRTIYAVSPFI